MTASRPEQDIAEYRLGIQSCLRTIGGAPPENRASVFDLFAREACECAARSEIAFASVADDLQEIAQKTGLTEEIGQDTVQAKIADAISAATAQPPNPPLAKSDNYREERAFGQNFRKLDLSSLPLSIDDWFARDLPQPDPLLGDWLTTTSRALLIAPTGLGKTNFAMQIGMSISAGLGFLNWRGHRPRRVLYIDGEMSRRLLRERIRQASERLGERPEAFFALSHEDIEDFAPLNTPEGQSCIEQVIARVGGIDLAIFDSVMCLTAGDMKDEESWARTMPWVRKLTRQSIAQLWVHHTGHDETRGYGTKTREWQLDTVVVLEPVKRDDADVSFRLEFKKARERIPETRADFGPMKVWLSDDWNWSDDGSGGKVNRRLSDRQRLSLDILVDCAVDHGKPPPAAFGLPTSLSAITLDLWRQELFVRGVIERDAKNPREAFRQIKVSLAARKLIGERDGYVWRAA